MKSALTLAFFLLFMPFGLAHAYDSADLKKANSYYDEKSYQLAVAEYEKLLEQKTDRPELAREVSLKWSDSILRIKDERNRQKAESRLADIINGKDKDEWQAEAKIALSRHYITRDPYGKQKEIKQWLDEARDWWAGSSDINRARTKFIDTSFMLADFVTQRWGWYATDIKPIRLGTQKIMPPIPPQQNNLGLQVLFEEILKVAKSDEDKAHAHYGLAMSWINTHRNDKAQQEKAIEKLRMITRDFRKTEWADDAFYQLGMYYERTQNFVDAVKTYREYISSFRPGESQWLNEAQRKIQYITAPSLSMSVGNTFIPGSEIQFHMNWRNVKQAQFTLYQLDMNEALQSYGQMHQISNYRDLLNRITDQSNHYKRLPVYQSWSAELTNEDKHIPRNEYKSLAHWRGDKDDKKENPDLGKLPVGAYLMMVEAGGKKAYDLILITDIALLTKISKDKAITVAMNAHSGKPVLGADIHLVYSYRDSKGHTQWAQGQGKTNEKGLLVTALENPPQKDNYNQNHNVFATLKTADNKQAFVQNNYYYYNNNNKGDWWLYAFANRPAYRPNEEVSYKGIVRTPEKGGFITHAGMKVKAVIQDAQGKKVKEQTYTLNNYGAFSDTMMLDEKAVLGQYTIILYADTGRHLSSAPLFRLEEYKLPEFTVNVQPQTKDEANPSAGYRLGDTLKIEIDSQYYFGGAVAEADVEYLIYQQPYRHYYRPTKRYPWYYEDLYPRPHSYGHGQLMKQDKIKTDKDGKAYIEFETPKDSGNDLKYHIEARVVDKSRREIIGSSDIKVTKNAYFSFLEPQNHLYRPGDKAKIDLKTLTANDAPIAVEGKITVARHWWKDPIILDGTVKEQGAYTENELFTKFIKTNDKGEAVFEFEPSENGYYVITYTGYDNGNEVIGKAYVYVCDDAAQNIGYRYGGLQIITEKDTYLPGETARAMIVSDTPDSWVLFTQESDELYGYEMLYMEGSVKSIDFKVQGNYTPNLFLNAVSGSNYQLKTATKQIIVPPDHKFLNVTITSDKQVYQPQEEGTFEITLTDNDGNPVSAEVALGLTDASVYYIQSEYAQDIRQFYYGDKKPQSIRTQTSFNQRRYVKFVRDENGNLMTEAQLEQQKRQKHAQNAYDDEVAPANIGRVERHMQARTPRGSSISSGAVGMAANRMASADMVMAESIAAPVAIKKAKESGAKNDGGAGAGGAEEERVRDDFRSTVIWQPSIITDKNGKATVKVKFPDSLTTWRMTARAITKDTAIGTVTHEVKSNKDLMIRLQSPRFFTQRDKTAISALIDNLSDQPITVDAAIKTDGLSVTGIYKDGKFMKGEVGQVTVPAKGQVRVGWAVLADQVGKATITVRAKGGKLSDAMQKSFTVIPHGIEKFIANSLVMKGNNTSQTQHIMIDVPAERIKETSSLRINLSPSMAANLLDALPYLADYPYGCVEQTMSRFLPATIVQKTMSDLGLSDQDIATYMSDVFEPRNDPQGHPQRRTDATFTKLDKMVGDGLNRLYDFQHSDGGWGWWKHGDSDRFMSAYVLWGLSLARKADVDVRADVIARAARYLSTELVEEENNPDMLAWMLHALAEAGSYTKFETKQRDRLWKMRDELNPYTRALFAISEYERGNHERSRILGQNVINGVQSDKENGTAHWGRSGIHYRWSEGGVEATAFNIKALSQINPQSEYLEPAVKWMALNRRGASWKNTRDTAISILGLTDYLKTTQELSPDFDYDIKVNGKSVRAGHIDASNVLAFNRIIDIPADQIKDGQNKVEVTMKGKGALYVSAHTKYFTLKDPIEKAGNEIFVTRKYYKQSVKETLMKGYTNDWAPLKDGDTIKSGDRVRVDIILDSKNHYEYLISEDYKPAGFEAVELKSGPGYAIMLDHEDRETQKRTPLYQEFRDQKAAFFITKLEQGKHLIRYELRAETPGEFHAMPNQSHAMYVPEIRSNSNETRFSVTD